MITQEIKYWIKLLSLPNVGPKTFYSLNHILQKERKNISDLFQINKQELLELAKTSNLRRGGEIVQNILDVDTNSETNDIIFQELCDRGIEVIPYTMDVYPQKLKKKLNDNAPPMLYIYGNKNLLKANSVAIIGKRDASEESIKVAKTVAEKMASEGYNIISGYAKGIDTAAHLGALASEGTTTIVLPFGIFEFKWKEEFKKIQNLKQNALIISQFPPNANWQVSSAMQRNATVVGLSDAVFAIEFNKNGGTWDAIVKALKIDIPVFLSDTPENRKIFIERQEKPIFIKFQELDIQSIVSTLKGKSYVSTISQ